MDEFTLAKRIDVVRTGRKARLIVDGKAFPWFTGAQGWDVQVRHDEIPSVTITLLAERVNVVDILTSPRFAVNAAGVVEVSP